MLLRYHFGSERLKGGKKKVELEEAIADFSRKGWEYLVQREGGEMSVVRNEAGREAVERWEEDLDI